MAAVIFMGKTLDMALTNTGCHCFVYVWCETRGVVLKMDQIFDRGKNVISRRNFASHCFFFFL